MKDIHQINKISLFASLPDEVAQSLIDAFLIVDHPAHVTLFHEGDPGESFSIVLEGEIEIVKALDTPEERLLSVVMAGDYLGEMSLLFPDGLRSASARTRTAVRTLEMTRSDFETLLEQQPHLALEFTREMNRRLRSNENATIRDLQAKNRELAQAYQELKAAQDQLIEQEKFSHELAIARQIQANMLPDQLPDIPGWQVDVFWQPARAVGGDFYDFIPFADGCWGIVIGDVSGKGIPAALVMATTSSILRTIAEQLVSPGQVLEQVNARLCGDMPSGMFVTCLYALLDPVNRILDFANAGHNLPCLYAPGRIVEPRARGMPLGLLPNREYEQIHFSLPPDHSILLYSDGLTESHSSTREMYGSERLHTMLSRWQPSPGSRQVRKTINYLLEDLAAFSGDDWDQEDDVTLLSIEPNPLAAK